MGDFNIDLLKTSEPCSDNFINTLGSFFYQPHILQPTRITDHTAALIDNLFFNSIEHFTISGNIVYDLTDHLPNFTILNKFGSLPPNIKVYRRDYSKFNESVLAKEVQSIDGKEVIKSDQENPPKMNSKTLYLELLEEKTKVRKELRGKETLFEQTEEETEKEDEKEEETEKEEEKEEKIEKEEEKESKREIPNQEKSETTKEGNFIDNPPLSDLLPKEEKQQQEDNFALEEKETAERRSYLSFKKEALKIIYPDEFIPDFSEYEDPQRMDRELKLLTNKLSLCSSIDWWKKLIIIFMMSVEVFLSYFSINVDGFSKFQLKNISVYDEYLVEIEEKKREKSGEHKIDVHWRLFGMMLFNVVFFIVGKMILEKTGFSIFEETEKTREKENLTEMKKEK